MSFPTWATAGSRSAPRSSPAAQSGEAIDLDLGRLDLGHGYDTPAIEAALRTPGSVPEPSPNLAVRVAELLGRGADRDVVSGAHGVRTAGARAPQRAGAPGSAATCAIG